MAHVILNKILHASRPIELENAPQSMAENFERVLGLRPGAVSVMMEEGKELTACSINPVPHVHYAVTIGYDDKNTLEAAAAEALKP